MISNKKTSPLTPKVLLSGIAGMSLVVGMALAPVSFDFQGGQLAIKSIAAYASEGSDESSDERSSSSDASDQESADVSTDNSSSDQESADVSTDNSSSDQESADVSTDSSDNDQASADVSTDTNSSDQAGDNGAKDRRSEKAGNERSGNEHAGNTAEKARELADKARELADKAGLGEGKSHDSKNGNQENDNSEVNTDAAPMDLSDFISSLRKGTRVTAGIETSSNINLSYSNGWKEEIANGHYVLVDPNGNTIISRTVKTSDIARLRSIIK